MILTNLHDLGEQVFLNLLESVAVILGIIFLAYTIPRLITLAIFLSYYEAKLKNMESTIKKWRNLNETK